VNRQCGLVAVITGLATMSMTPVLAAPREIEIFCLEQLRHVPLSHPRGTGEAFMANCIANLTPTPSPGPKEPFAYDGRVIPRPK
jgi:hypothetical protein